MTSTSFLRRHRPVARSIALSLAAACAAGWAADIQVPADQPTIQAAIDAARPGDRVLVSPGHYDGPIDFDGKDIQVIAPQGEASIDGHLGRREAYPVVNFSHGETRAAVLSGFSIIRGKHDGYGGGIYIAHSSPTVTDNVIEGCEASVGGGGIYVLAGAPWIHHNRVRDNHSPSGRWGGGILVDQSTGAHIEDNLILGNDVRESGGGIAVIRGARAVVARNVIRENSARFGGGAGLYLGSSRAAVVDNVIVGNDSHRGGSGVWIDVKKRDSGAVLVSNTIADNVNEELHVEARSHRSVRLANNIFRTTRGTHSLVCDTADTARVRFGNSLVHSDNGAKIEGSCDFSRGKLIDADPRFQGTDDSHAYWLTRGSPAIDAGQDEADERIRTDATGAPRIIGGTVDLGAYEFRQD